MPILSACICRHPTAHPTRRHPVFCILRGLLLPLVVLLLASCRSPRPDVPIITTTTFLADAVNLIGHPHLSARPLMGPGLDPHQYRATPGDIRQLVAAKGVVMHGLHLEAKMGDVLAALPQRPLVVGDAIPPHQLIRDAKSGGIPDPHIWFDPSLWALVLQSIATYLSHIDPPHAPVYRANLAAALQQLHDTDQACRVMISRIPPSRRVLITSHDAFRYFGRYYGITVMGVQGTSTLAEPNPSDIDQLATLITQRGIPAIFIESSVSDRHLRAVQAAVAAKGGKVTIAPPLFSDSTGKPHTPQGTYDGVLRYNVTQMARYLQ